MVALTALISVLCACTGSASVLEYHPPLAQVTGGQEAVAVPVLLDSTRVFIAVGPDSTAAIDEAGRVEAILVELLAHASTPQRIRLVERDHEGIILLDTLEVLRVREENRVHTELSPLANALALREEILSRGAVAEGEKALNEEELLLRLLLGIVYPFLMLVVLRMTRTGIHKWEANWRGAALQWLRQIAERRGMRDEDIRGRNIINFLVGIERLAAYGAAFLAISFIWFALFPQTQPLAASLLASIITPILDLLGGTAQGILLLGYSAFVVLLAFLLTRRLSQRRSLGLPHGILTDPVVYFPLQVAVWIVAVFLILFPYPGVPRFFAVGLMLIVLFAALIASRPLIEELAAGMYINSTYALKMGDHMTVDGVPYRIVTPGLIHLLVMRGDERHWLSYSRILKSDLAFSEAPKTHRV